MECGSWTDNLEEIEVSIAKQRVTEQDVRRKSRPTVREREQSGDVSQSAGRKPCADEEVR
jgi:hypothetical protein